jgi:ATP-dependent DNA helicase RecG
MQGRDQIIQLGKILAEEQRRGCDDSAVEGGLERFLAYWRGEANGALNVAAVQQALDLLDGYSQQPLAARQERLDRALADLRALFRAHPDSSQSTPPPASTRQRPSAASQRRLATCRV